MRYDGLVLILLWHELRGTMRTQRPYDLAWITLGGGILVGYGVADAVVALRNASAVLRHEDLLWMIAVPSGLFGFGGLTASAIGRLTAARAFAPFLKALPISLEARCRAAGIAALLMGIPLLVAAGLMSAAASAIAGPPFPLAYGFLASGLFATGYLAGLALGIARARRGDQADPVLTSRSCGDGSHPGILGLLDRGRPAWLSSWAWNIPGRVRITWRLVASALVLFIVVTISMAASLVSHAAAPAAMAALAVGIAVFMLSLRFHPLGSPVLRASPIGFTHARLRLMRLPFKLSVATFVLPASVAVAAEPASWEVAAGSGIALLALNAAYAAFAAYFMTAPLLAVVSFSAAIAFCGYESFEYGRTVLIGFATLVAWLWHKARSRYNYG
ncbi:hypothetical protein ABLE91_26020 [Aquabacter sp. CN5-332]|uniref:hypothetical protein n=1 Tax=Aquabacter sp. CN5-332 TaxID=3156608 RepID=UPI0032B33D01